MTVVNPKSISGINSITMASGSDNLLTIHTTNTTERVRINSSGDVIVGSGITVSPDGDIFATGVTTSTTFVGALTGNVTGNISGGTVAGSTGTFTGDVDIADKIVHTGDTNTAIRFPAADTITAETAGEERLRINSSGNVGLGQASPSSLLHLQDLSANGYELKLSGNSVSFNRTSLSYIDQLNDSGSLVFRMTSSNTEALRITSAGNIGINNNNPQNKLLVTDSGSVSLPVIQSHITGSNGGFLGLGLYSDVNSKFTFSVTNNGRITANDGIIFGSDTSTDNLLHDYEEGTFTPTLEAASNPSMSYTNQGGKYTKIGNLVYVTVDLRWSGRSGGSGNAKLGSLPFTSSSSQPYTGGIVFEKLALTSHADEAIISLEVGSNQAFGTFLSTVHDDSASTSGLVIGNFQNTTGYFMISFSYFTN